MALPARFLAYGAYSLSHDKLLGKPASGTGPIFFKYLHDKQYPVNLVRVICFRYSGQDSIPANRQLSVYTPQRQINTTYLDNLSNLVDQARQFGFWVQVCLFSFQSIVGGEQPENPPTVFGLANHGVKPPDAGTSRAWLRAFFNAADANRFNEQAKLVKAIADRLRVYPNVLWELANELRISNQNNPPVEDNCGLVTWLNQMRPVLVHALQGTKAYITTSSGLELQSERFFFKRLAADACPSPALPVEFFDFHHGQWTTVPGITAAKQRALGYNPSAFLIIDDDGTMGLADPTAIRSWAAAAFRNGLHYSAKQTYPPLDWNTDVLDKLKQAWDNPNAY